MKKVYFSLFVMCSLLGSSYCASQNKNVLAKVIKIKEKPAVYKISLYNNSDSVLYFLISGLLSPLDYRNDTIIELVPFKLGNEKKYHYKAQFTSANNDISLETPYNGGIAILPYQAKDFLFSIGSNKPGVFELEYFYLLDYSHVAFKIEVSKPHWFKKYMILKEEIPF